jgi:hypothetical protein
VGFAAIKRCLSCSHEYVVCCAQTGLEVNAAKASARAIVPRQLYGTGRLGKRESLGKRINGKKCRG